MAIKDLLKRLSYSKCKCVVVYKEELGIVNGVCSNHKDSVLMIDGIRMSVYKKLMQVKLDKKPNQIV